MTDSASVQRLIAALKNYRTRPAAHRDLLKLGSAAVAPLIQLLADKEAPENARWAAISIMGELKVADASGVLTDIAKADTRLRSAACQALQCITGKELGEDIGAWERLQSASGTDAGGGPLENPDFVMVRDAMGNAARDIAWETPGYVYMRVLLEAGRTQQMVLTFESAARPGSRQISVYTECGVADSIPSSLIDRRNVTLRYGKFYAEKDDASGKYRITLRHVLSLDKLDPAAFRDIVVSLGYEADSLEYEISGTDHI